MIINTGARTDIPAFFSTWFLNRIKEGFVYVRNPYYRQQVTRYKLTQDVVDCLIFCTKNPRQILLRLYELDVFARNRIARTAVVFPTEILVRIKQESM